MAKSKSIKKQKKEMLSRAILNTLDGKNKKVELSRLKKELKEIENKQKKIKEKKKQIALEVLTNNKKYKTNDTLVNSELNLGKKLINPKALLKSERDIENLTDKKSKNKLKRKKKSKNTQIMKLTSETLPIRIWKNNKKSFKDLKLTDSPQNPLTWPIAKDGTPKKAIYLQAPQENHTIIIGDTGSGKTAFVLQATLHTIASSTDEPSVVLTDPKGEVYDKTSLWFKQNGYDIKTLNLVTNKSIQGLYWNPMTEIKILHNKVEAIEKLIKVINEHQNKKMGVQELFKNKDTKKILKNTYYSVLKESTYKNRETAIIKYIVNPILTDNLPDATNTKLTSDLTPYANDENARVDDYVYLIGNDKPVSTSYLEEYLLNALEMARDKIVLKRDNLVSDTVKTFVDSDDGSGSSNDTENFFKEQSRKYIQFWIELLMYDKKCGVEYFSLHNVTSLASTYRQVSDDGDTEDLTKIKEYINGEMKAYQEEFGVEHPLQTDAAEWTNPVGSVGTFSSSLSSALGTVTPFTAAGHWIASSTTTINFEDIIKKKTILYIMKPDSDKSKDAYVIMFFVRLYKALTELSYMYPGGKLPRLCYFIIEEFASMPKFKDFDTHITIARGRGIRFTLILQSYDQLDKKYGSGAANVIRSNCKTHIWVNSNDQKSRNEYKEKLGAAKYIKFDKEKISREEVEKLADDSTIFSREDEPMLKHLSEETKPLISQVSDLGLPENNYNKMVIADMSGHNPIKMYLLPFWEIKWKVYASADLPADDTSKSFKDWAKKHRYNPMHIPEEDFVGDGIVGGDTTREDERLDLSEAKRRFEEAERKSIEIRKSYNDLNDENFESSEDDDDEDESYFTNGEYPNENYSNPTKVKELKEVRDDKAGIFDDEEEAESVDTFEAADLEYDDDDDDDLETSEEEEHDENELKMYDNTHRVEKYEVDNQVVKEEELESYNSLSSEHETEDEIEEDIVVDDLFSEEEPKNQERYTNQTPTVTNYVSNQDNDKIKEILNPVFEKQDRMARDMEDLKHMIRNQQPNNAQLSPKQESTLDKLFSLMLMKEMGRMNGTDTKKESNNITNNQVPVNFNPYSGAQYPFPTNITMIPNVPIMFNPTTGAPMNNTVQPQQQTNVNGFNNQSDPTKYHPYIDPNREMKFNPYNGGFLKSQPLEFKMRGDTPFLFDPYNGKQIVNLDNGKNHLKNKIPNFKIDVEKEIKFNPYDGRNIKHQQTPFRVIDKEPFFFNPYSGEQIISEANGGFQEPRESLNPLKQQLQEQELKINELLNREPIISDNSTPTSTKQSRGFLKAKSKNVNHLSNPYKDELVTNFRKNIDPNLKPDIDPIEEIKKKIRES